MLEHRLGAGAEACASTLLEVEATLDLLGLHVIVHEVTAAGHIDEEDKRDYHLVGAVDVGPARVAHFLQRIPFSFFIYLTLAIVQVVICLNSFDTIDA